MKWPQVLLLNLSGIGYCSTSKMAAQSYLHGINWWKCVRLFWYSDWLSRYQHLKLEYLKICGPYCINGHHRTNIKINIKISQHTFLCHYSWNVLWQLKKWNWQKSVKSIYPIKFAQSGCIPHKIKCKILAHKGSQTTCTTPGHYLTSWNHNPIGTSWHQWRWIKISRKINPWQAHFLISNSQRGIEEDDTIMSKVAKGKGKMEKPQNVLRGKTTNWLKAFIIMIRGNC